MKDRLRQANDDLASLQKSYDLRGTKLIDAQGELFVVREQLATLTETVADQRSALNRAATELAEERRERETKAESLDREAEGLRAQLSERLTERDELRGAVERLTKELDEASHRQEGEKRAEDAFQSERNTRFHETARLTQLAEDLRAQLEQATAKLAALNEAKQQSDQSSAALRHQLELVRAEQTRLQQHNLELLASTSWRVTAPMRAVKRSLTGK